MIHPKEFDDVLIVGAGCFGISTAYHLLKRGFKSVTVLERSDSLPARDAASNDMNRIVRTSYNDRFYSLLAKEAILAWKDRALWGTTYHESGVVLLAPTRTQSSTQEVASSASSAPSYAAAAYENDVAIGVRVQKLDPSSAGRIFPTEVKFSPAHFEGDHVGSYLNEESGWANAAQGMEILISEVVRLGGKVLPSKAAVKLLRSEEGKTIGVECQDGSVYNAGLIILAVGSWTASAFPELNLSKRCVATGQCVAMIKLSEDEAERYRKCPVVLDFTSGFYVFPPNDQNIVKIAIHDYGHTVTKAGISTPRTVVSDGEHGLLIPKAVLSLLRNELRRIFPDLAERPFVGTRLCWYNDSPDADFIIGRHAEDDSILLATGDSGHAYKFLPVIGRLVVEAATGTLDPSLVAKFSPSRQFLRGDRSRIQGVGPTELDITQLSSPEDLIP